MKCIVLLWVLVAFITLLIETSGAAATTKPFVRSRYSKRWRIILTTESNIGNNTLTAEPQKGMLASGGTTTVNNMAGPTRIEDTTVGRLTALPLTTYITAASTQKLHKYSHSTTTEHPRHTGPNGAPLDYDYYGNGGENEDDAAHK